MKKVVINNQYGGFSLSSEALVLLHMMKFPMTGTPPERSGFKESEFVLHGPHGYRAHPHMGAILKDGLVYHYYDSKNDFALRSHPALVKVVETLGDRASRNPGDLAVKEIDDVMYTIDSYDGLETLRELKSYGYVQGYNYEDVPLPAQYQLENSSAVQPTIDSDMPAM